MRMPHPSRMLSDFQHLVTTLLEVFKKNMYITITSTDGWMLLKNDARCDACAGRTERTKTAAAAAATNGTDEALVG